MHHSAVSVWPRCRTSRDRANRRVSFRVCIEKSRVRRSSARCKTCALTTRSTRTPTGGASRLGGRRLPWYVRRRIGMADPLFAQCVAATVSAGHTFSGSLRWFQHSTGSSFPQMDPFALNARQPYQRLVAECSGALSSLVPYSCSFMASRTVQSNSVASPPNHAVNTDAHRRRCAHWWSPVTLVR